MLSRLQMDKTGFGHHVLNRSNGRLTIFAQDSDYLAFENVLCKACEREAMRLLVPYPFFVGLW